MGSAWLDSNDPMSWSEFFRGLLVAMAVGVAAAAILLVPWMLAGLLWDRLVGA